MFYEADESECKDILFSGRKEWLLTNGLGGFAMGTVAGLNSRRYHGLLVAAVKPPTDRWVLLAGVDAAASIGNSVIPLSSNRYRGAIHPKGHLHLSSFKYGGHVAKEFSGEGIKVRKEIGMTWGENTTTCRWTNLCPQPIALSLKPLVCHQFYHGNFRADDSYPESIDSKEGTTRISDQEISLFLQHEGAEVIPSHGWYYHFEHEIEAERGLDAYRDLFCPMELKIHLMPDQSFALVASTEEFSTPYSFTAFDDVWDTEESLRQSTKHFLIEAPQRTSILAGLPWFTDWGRDTMIALPGICLSMGRLKEARQILRSFAAQMTQGLIPNRFVDQGEEPDTNTVDATLWFAHAIHQTLEADWNEEFARDAIEWLTESCRWHVEGTLFGIKVDPEDGLLAQGEEGVQLTWMDVKIGDWVVTPRLGKPIEINALWINFLRVIEWLSERLDEDGLIYRLAAEKAESNFHSAFWRDSLGWFLDTADPDDGSLRPNQVIAMSLPFSPISTGKAVKALAVVREHLLTPKGLRTLTPGTMDYVPRFEGDMKARDAAYHQGTVWPWLTGCYITALIKHGLPTEWIDEVLDSVPAMLKDQGLGGIAEVYDAEAPQRAQGCPWQAWSTAEILRAFEARKKVLNISATK